MANITSLIRILIEDVIASQTALSVSDTPVNRRNLIRTTFAAAEGLIWLTRQHVRESAQAMDQLSPLADLALTEQSYQITASGEVVEAVKFVPMSTSIRLIVRQAQLIAPELEIDFNDAGWQSLRQAIERRNRLTHPKALVDLDVTETDLTTCERGFEWLLAVTTNILSQTTQELAVYSVLTRKLLNDLKNGNPAALAAYYALLDTDP